MAARVETVNAVAVALIGGDRRSLGGANAVARSIVADPIRFADAVAAMLVDDPVVRMRAADAVEKASRANPALLVPHTRQILHRAARIDQPEVRWHVAQIIPRLALTARETTRATAILFEYLEDESRIVRTCAMQALADLALRAPALRRRVLPVLRRLTDTGTPAMRARGRKLLAVLAR